MATSVSDSIVSGRTLMLLTLVGACGAYCVGNASWFMQPVLIERFISIRGLTPSSAGFVLSVEMGFLALTSILLAKVLKGGRFLTLAVVGMCVAVVGTYISIKVVHSLAALVLSRAFAGIGEGMVLMVANSAVVYFKDREKTFGIMSVASVLFGVVLVGLTPQQHVGDPGFAALTALLVALCILFPLILLLPRSLILRPEAEAIGEEARARNTDTGMRILLLSIGALTIGMASGIMWSFYAVIGGHTGLAPEAVNQAIAVAILTAVIGGSLTALLGKSFGRLLPVSAGLAVLSGAIAVLSSGPGVLAFRIAACVNVMAMYFVMPYFFAAGSAQDNSGRGAAYVGGAFTLSGALSPFIGGVLSETIGTRVMGVVVIGASVFAWILFAVVERRTERAVRAQSLS